MATSNAAGQAGRRLHRIDVASSRLQPLAFGESLKLRREDIAVFSAAAELFDHIIIVRATNLKSLNYIGQKNYTPKPIDCKPKTADSNCFVQDLNLYSECGGLVVDPTMVSFAAFASDGKRRKAHESWLGFLRDKTKEEKARKVFRRRETKGFYAVDTLHVSRHFGCVMLSNQDMPADDFHLGGRGWQRFKQTEMRYVHGDYDLYGMIDLSPADWPSLSGSLANRSPRVLKERLHGTPHYYSAKFPADPAVSEPRFRLRDDPARLAGSCCSPERPVVRLLPRRLHVPDRRHRRRDPRDLRTAVQAGSLRNR